MTIVRMKIARYSKVFCRMTPEDCKNIVNKKTKAALIERIKAAFVSYILFESMGWSGIIDAS